ncbi:uncharacterized protein VTP21DRAFT_11506 [Calcarisporiella thermophila]|uniref:uncharacterized protein n=1 Tax=Calcarisporiella thermophila TaxID=911321 RepID=UPI00374298EC
MTDQDYDTTEQSAEISSSQEVREESPPQKISKTIQAFPVFEQKKPTAKDIAFAKSLGVPEWLAKPTHVDPENTTSVDDVGVGLSSHIIQRCKEVGIEELFSVQAAVIPILFRSRLLYERHQHPSDICVSAPTGSGKTLAYVLPIVEILSKRIVTRLRALIVLPTRDLVLQVKEVFDAFCKGTSLKVTTVTGQHSFAHEQSQLVDTSLSCLDGGASKVDILIATPGRLIDHINSTPNFTLQHLRFLIIDEADRLLNQSYHDWLTHILRALEPPSGEGIEKKMLKVPLDNLKLPIHDAVAPHFIPSLFSIPDTDLTDHKPPIVQKLLFSATLTRNPAKIASLHLINPHYIAVQSSAALGVENVKYTTPSGLREHMIVCESAEKPMIVMHLLKNVGINSALCFTKSVEAARRLCKLVSLFDDIDRKNEGVGKVTVAEFSSELDKKSRTTLLKRFARGEIQLLVCSDLIARGVDLERVQVVISYDVPVFMKKYIHRVGRTARAGREGDAYTIVETQEARHFKEMLTKANHLDRVKKMNIGKPILDAMMPTYQKALKALRDTVTGSKKSVRKYLLKEGEDQNDDEVTESESESTSSREDESESENESESESESEDSSENKSDAMQID